MRMTTIGGALVACVLALGACGGDDDSSDADTDEGTEATQSDDDLRQQYVDAIAFAVSNDAEDSDDTDESTDDTATDDTDESDDDTSGTTEPDDADDADDSDDTGDDSSDTTVAGEEAADAADEAAVGDDLDDVFADLSDDDAQCVGEAYVDVIGVDELEAVVTPDEIRESPDNDHDDWGIELTDEQGTEIYRGIVDCSPDAGAAFTAGVAQGVTEGLTEESPDAASAIDQQCLADADPADLEGFMGAALAQGDDFTPNDAQATELVDWIGGCGDLRQLFLTGFASDPSIPAGVPECLGENLDDQFIQDFWRAAFTSAGDTESMEGSPLMTELEGALTQCMGQSTPTTAAG